MQGLPTPGDVGNAANAVCASHSEGVGQGPGQTGAAPVPEVRNPLAADASEAPRVTCGGGLYAFRHTSVSDQPGMGRDGKNRDARLFALNDDQLDAWNERVAICMVDGGLSQEEAEAVAWREVEGQPVQPVDAHVGPQAASVAEGVGGANG